MNLVIGFITSFIIKWFTGPAIEKIVLILIKKLVEHTDSKVDDELYEAVFKKTKEGADNENK